MSERAINEPKKPDPLLDWQRVRDDILSECPEYGEGREDVEWRAMTERLEALARVFWRVAERHAREAHGDAEIRE